MEAVKKAPETTLNRRSGGSRWRRLLMLLHPGVIVLMSLVLAGGIFLSGWELHVLVGDSAALYKLLAGGALLSILGIFFAQQAMNRASARERHFWLMRQEESLKAMTGALQGRADIQENRAEYEKFGTELRRKI